MARGRGRGGKHSQSRGGPKRKYGGESRHEALSKRQKTHLKQYGEIHPADEVENNHAYRKVVDEDTETNLASKGKVSSSEDESEEEEEQFSAFKQLISTISTTQTALSDDDSDEEEDVTDEDDGSEEDQIEGDEDQQQADDDDDDNIDEEVDTKYIDAAEKKDADDYRELEDQSDDDNEESEIQGKESDPFSKHYEHDIGEKLSMALKENNVTWTKQQTKLPMLGNCVQTQLNNVEQLIPNTKEKDLRKLNVKQKLCEEVAAANQKLADVKLADKEHLSSYQRSLFSVINNYQDLYSCERTSSNGEEIRLMYCLHALNHVLKTRSRVIAHNNKIKTKKDDISDDYRDQGLTRPKVLMVLPFRESAKKVVTMLLQLLLGDEQKNVLNKKRFFKEFGDEEPTKRGNKSDDFYETFDGNTDDHFRIGIGVSKKSLKLYTEFYAADIILASPLGLRTIIAGEDDDGAKGEHDFLSSIEVLIMDQMDVFLMQNWEHIMYLLSHLHLQPKESHGVDFSRVRMWTLDGMSKFYRQSLLFSGVPCPEISAVFNKHCHNWAGKVAVPHSMVMGSICQVGVTLSQVFQRVDVTSVSQVADARFEYFKTKVLSQYKDKLMGHTLIFVSSYFDFVRLRNYIKKEDLSSVQLCEYSKDEYMDRSRSAFFHSLKQFMVYTERLHFYRRFRMRGVKHIIFYQLPLYAHFYSELCNMLADPKQKVGGRMDKAGQNFTCSVLYTKYDAHRLAAVVGTERAGHMISAEKNVHMLVTGEEEENTAGS